MGDDGMTTHPEHHHIIGVVTSDCAACMAGIPHRKQRLAPTPDPLLAGWTVDCGIASCPFRGVPHVGHDDPDPQPLAPDDHGHTGRLWCDPCVAHGVMLEQGIHRCAPTPDRLNGGERVRLAEALSVPAPRWLDEYGGGKGWDEAMDSITAALIEEADRG
jgi:hypothetical protein